MAAVKKCNRGGHVLLDAPSYTVTSPLDLTSLDHIDIEIAGELRFGNSVEYWAKHAFKYPFQDSYSYMRIGGRNVNIFGNGTVDGNGPQFYKAWGAAPDATPRPLIMTFDGITGATMSGLHLVNAPMWFIFVRGAKYVVFSDLHIRAENGSGIAAKNTDGWDIYQSDNIVIQNSVIENGDDCVSFKPNSTNVFVQGLDCLTLPGGSGGISVGSLGQYPGVLDIVENVLVDNCTIRQSESGARIKAWPSEKIDAPFHAKGGGGLGVVRDITYSNILLDNVTLALDIRTCYGVSNQSLCASKKSGVAIESVTFTNLYGKTSKAKAPYAGTISCAANHPCNGLSFSRFDVTAADGHRNLVACANVDKARLRDLTCVSSFIQVLGSDPNKTVVQPKFPPAQKGLET